MSTASWNIARVGMAWSVSIPPKQKLALLYLADSGDEDGFRTPDMSKLSWFIGCTQDQARRTLGKLARRGLIERSSDGQVRVALL